MNASPRSGLVVTVFVALAAMLGLALVIAGRAKPTTESKTAAPTHPQTIVAPAAGAYTGAYMDFGDTEDDVTLEAIEGFEELVGKHQAIVAFSSFWGEQKFPQTQVQIISRHGSAPLIFWSPWDQPYQESLVLLHGPDRFSLANIAAGKWDAYIDAWADAAKATGQPMFVSLCNEMNGNWFPWGGVYYGGDKVVPGTSPPRYEGPEFFKRTYRYIVDRVRARGARNIQWVFHVNNFSEPLEKWTEFAQYYPGTDYVDWLGMSAYGQQWSDGKWEDFASQVRGPYDELCRLDPVKPVMITEWGVGEFPKSGSKAGWISSGFEQMKTECPRLRAAIYWHERWQNSETQFYSNLKVNSSPEALAAYRNGVENSFWLGDPKYK